MNTYNRKELMSFMGIQPKEITKTWKENWEEIYHDDGCLILVSSRVYSATEDEELPEFKYRYIVKVIDMQAYGSDRSEIAVQLFMCPLSKYIRRKNLSKIINGDYNVDECDTWFFEDAADQGIIPLVDIEYLEYSPDDVPADKNGNKWYDYFYDVLKHPQMELMLNTITTCLDEIDSLKGLWLDECFNQLGTTGWDLLKDLLLGEDWLKASINRIKEKGSGNYNEE